MVAEHARGDLCLWVYVSEACLEGRSLEEAVADIISVSRPRNAQLQVTGALVLACGRFAQLLEGPEAGVNELKGSICRDGRHRRVTTLCFHAVKQRIFDKWSLVYSGGSRYMAAILERVELEAVPAGPEACEQLLYMFREFAQAERQDGFRR